MRVCLRESVCEGGCVCVRVWEGGGGVFERMFT